MEDGKTLKWLGFVFGLLLLVALMAGILTADRTIEVTYDWGYDGRTEAVVVEQGKLDAPRGLVRVGYKLEGWFYQTSTGEELCWDFEADEARQDVTLYAQWAPNRYTLTLNPRGGDSEMQIMTVTYGESYTLPNLQREGYIFAGWYDALGERYNSEGIWKFEQDVWLDATWITYPLGMTVTCGAYEQDNDVVNGTEPIEWLVLDYREGRYLLISRYILDASDMTDETGRVPWANCKLRLWLDEVFGQVAFTEEERRFILPTECADTNTTDRVFLLSREEVDTLMFTREHMQGVGTPYAKAQGLEIDNGLPPMYSWWWLRHKNGGQFTAADGGAYAGMGGGRGNVLGVRPAIWLDEAAIADGVVWVN